MAIIVNPGATFRPAFQAPDGDETLTVTAKIFQDGSQIGSNISCSHVSGGLYEGSATAPSSEGDFSIQYTNNSALFSTETTTLSVIRSWRPSFGAGAAEVDISGIKAIVDKSIEEKLKIILDELAKKSEFNPKSDLVKTDIRPTSLRPILDKIDKVKPNVQPIIQQVKSTIKSEMKNVKLPPQVDRTDEVLNKIKNQTIHVTAEPDPRLVNAMVEQNQKIDALNRGILSTIKTSFNTISKQIQPFLKVNNILERFKSEKRD